MTHINKFVVYIHGEHEHKGRLARLAAYDWEYGTMLLELADGQRTQIPDGMCAGEPASPAVRYLRFDATRSGYRPGVFDGRKFLDDRLDEGCTADEIRRLAMDYHTLFGSNLTDDMLSPHEKAASERIR